MINNDNITFCNRCYHSWKRRKDSIPKRCPRCKSPYWNKLRKRISERLILDVKKEVIEIHDSIIDLSGGHKGVREDGGIYYSVMSMLKYRARHMNKPTNFGAFIINEFAKKHHFMDGNKRIAYALCKIFMLTNKCHLKVSYLDASKFIIEIADYNSKVTLDEIKLWLESNCESISDKDIATYLKKVFYDLSMLEKIP